jgi:hypothetical protein
MGLTTALVDRARIVSAEKMAEKVDGSTKFADISDEWFRCRLIPAASPEVAVEGQERTRVVTRARLLVGVRDLSGQPVRLDHTARVEVDSPDLGIKTYEIVEQPRPIRKRRRIMGYVMGVKVPVD